MGNYAYRSGKPHVAVPNDVFVRLYEAKTKIDKENFRSISEIKTSGLDVVEAFTLYFVFLLRMDWKYEVEIQMKYLAEKYFGKPRPETWTVLNRYILILKVAELIDYNGKRYTGSDIICVCVIPVEKQFSLIACVNEYLITRPTTGKSNATFALHCLLNIKRIDKNDKWEPIEINQDSLAIGLAVSKETIRDSIDTLFKGGYVRRPPVQYYNDNGTTKSYCLMYTVHDYDEPVDNAKIVAGIEKQKAAKQSKKKDMETLKRLIQDFEQTPILLIGEYVKLLEVLLNKNPAMQKKFYSRYKIETISEVAELIAYYDRMKSNNGMFLTIELPQESITIQGMFLKFIEDNAQLSIVVLSESDNITAAFRSRMRHCLKKSAVKVREIRFEPIHKGYRGYEKKYSYYKADRVIDHALTDCPELLIPTATNTGGNNALYRLDNLISRLTGGKTYIDVIGNEPPVTATVADEIKYLSLILQRSDLAMLSIEEYENKIESHILGVNRDESC